MKAWVNQYFLYLAILMYTLLWLVLHPAMAYLLDSDAVAYLTIAHRVAGGDWFTSVNGLWSPLNSWLLVPFIKMGVDSWLAAKVLNFFCGGLVLILSYALFVQLRLEAWIRNVFAIALVVVLCYYSYAQIFGDVLQLIFALGYVILFTKKNFVLRTKYVVWAAVIMGLGFYAKSYSLVFFIMHFSVICFTAWKNNKPQRVKVMVNYVVGILIAIIIVLPWSFQLQKKYEEFSLTGFAGKLNMSWYINSGKTFKDDIQLLIPPAYEDSPSFWEDPYLSQGELSTPLSSGHHFKRWGLRVGHTCLMAMICVSGISIFFIPIVLLYFFQLYKKKKIGNLRLKVFLALLILPLGYLAMHIETRYIWLNSFLILPLGIWMIDSFSWTLIRKRVAHVVFICSFLILPLSAIYILQGKNKQLFQLAEELKAHNISGKIVSNINDEGSFWVVSYLAGLNNYTIEKSRYTLAELKKEMNRYGVRYYYHVSPPRMGGGIFHEKMPAFQDEFRLLYQSKKSEFYNLYELKD